MIPVSKRGPGIVQIRDLSPSVPKMMMIATSWRHVDINAGHFFPEFLWLFMHSCCLKYFSNGRLCITRNILTIIRYQMNSELLHFKQILWVLYWPNEFIDDILVDGLVDGKTNLGMERDQQWRKYIFNFYRISVAMVRACVIMNLYLVCYSVSPLEYFWMLTCRIINITFIILLRT